MNTYRTILLSALALGMSASIMGQTKEHPAVKTTTVTTAEYDNQAISLAVAQYQLAALQLQAQAQKQLDPLDKAISAAITKAKQDQGLGDDYKYDFATQKFVKNTPPAPAQTPATANPTQATPAKAAVKK